MPYASFHDEPKVNRQNNTSSSERNDTPSVGKAIARVYGYMGIALLITATVALGFAWLFSSKINFALDVRQFDIANNWAKAAVATWIISLIAILVLTFVIPIRMARGKHSLWVPYILYSVFMGALLSAVLLTGISMYVVAEAFGITALAFGAMFLIGTFSKTDLTPLAFIAMGLLMMVMVVGLIGGITFLVSRNAQGFRWLDLGISAIMVVVIMLITAVDTYRIKRIAEQGEQSTNVFLYCAFVMYTDFISLLLRILYILARTQRN